ncbi:MAG: hypothetical protein SO471_12375 [Anaerobutyricum hallii]|nr:hypothetical protein [Anaerobutyricum hallii]
MPECINYFKIQYENEVYTIEEFSKKYKQEEFDIDLLLPQCSFLYRGNKYTYKEYCTNRDNFDKSLRFYERWEKEILPLEIDLQIGNYEYYQASKFLENAEECLQTARYYLQQSEEIFEYDCNINWKAGYAAIFNIRCMNFKTAVIWYNNCYDYILQIPFLAFHLYKGMQGYKPEMQLEDVLKMCTFKVFRNLHEKNLQDDNITELWNILNDCRKNISDITNWANYSKHKGGLGFLGLKPESPFQIYVRKENKVQKRTDEFECIKLDLDEAIKKVAFAHEALYDCLDKLVDFIGFDKVKHSLVDGKIQIPDKSDYVKINI